MYEVLNPPEGFAETLKEVDLPGLIERREATKKVMTLVTGGSSAIFGLALRYLDTIDTEILRRCGYGDPQLRQCFIEAKKVA